MLSLIGVLVEGVVVVVVVVVAAVAVEGTAAGATGTAAGAATAACCTGCCALGACIIWLYCCCVQGAMGPALKPGQKPPIPGHMFIIGLGNDPFGGMLIWYGFDEFSMLNPGCG